MKKLFGILIVLSFIMESSAQGAGSSAVLDQNPEAILTHLDLKSKPMLKRTESLYRTVETPQLNKLESGYLLTYTDEHYNGHLVFLDDEFQVKKDVRLAKCGIVKVCTEKNQIVLLKCKYSYQKEGKDLRYWEHNLFFERYSLDGTKISRTKLIGDQYYLKGKNNRTYRADYESSLIEHNGDYYASFEFQFNTNKKYDCKHYRLVKISPDNKVIVLNTMYKHVIESKLLVHKDTLFHIYTQTRGPRAIVLQKYALDSVSKIEIVAEEVKNTGKDVDYKIRYQTPKIVLFSITDGVDNGDYLCKDDHVPVRIENAFISSSGLSLLLCSMQDRKTYDLILANYELNGKARKEIPLATNRYYHETSCYAKKVGDSLQLVYKTIDESGKRPDVTKVATVNLNTKAKSEHVVNANFIPKPVFKFYTCSSGAYGTKLFQRDVNTNHYNCCHANTPDGMAILNWNEQGIDIVHVIIPR
ncbi:MAG: hypothetical protein JKY54_06500 [Flavobacteriales bacterium]|nr:hypothetical protein [Flavobacteriales bacterium]